MSDNFIEDLLSLRRAIDETARNFGVLKTNQEQLTSPRFRPEFLDLDPSEIPTSKEAIAQYAQNVVDDENEMIFESMIVNVHFLRASLFVAQAEMELSLKQNSDELADCLEKDQTFLSSSYNAVAKRKMHHDNNHRISTAHAMILGQQLASFGEDMYGMSNTPQKLQKLSIPRLHEAIFTLRAACSSFILQDANLHLEMVEARQKRLAVFWKGIQKGTLDVSSHTDEFMHTDKRACAASLRVCARHIENVESYFYGLHRMGTSILTGSDFKITRYASIPLHGLNPDYS